MQEQGGKVIWPLPVRGEPFERPTQDLLDGLGEVSAATACATLHGMGLRRTFMEGPRALDAGARLVGSALTLQFMPQREDIADGLGQEEVEKHTALWAVLESVQPGDVLVVQAWGDAFTGCFGDMLVRYFKKRGGAGIVVDGRIRDAPRVRELGVPIWCTGTTPHYASQSGLFPWAYDVPVAAGGVLCLPGDLIVADADGAVVVPAGKATELASKATAHEGWEEFSRMRLDEGARLSDYYPLSSANLAEYHAWEQAREAKAPAT